MKNTTSASKIKASIGYIHDDNSGNFEVINSLGRRLQPKHGMPGIYRQYSTESDAAAAAKKIARERHANYVGEVGL